jgi:hypothetical protein
MNIHARLIGAFDAVILSLTAFVMIALLSGVASEPQQPLRHGSVEIRQIG